MTYDPGVFKAELIRDEGRSFLPYPDTEGHLTIGIGHNLERPISERAVKVILEDDIADHEAELDRNIPWWRRMTPARQRALLNMCFNLGWPKLSGFKEMLLCLQAGSYARAAGEALDSKWARQVGDRALKIAKLIEEG